jgi:hypothetical protein
VAAANKTVAKKASPASFLAAVADPGKRADAQALAKLMAKATGEPAVMWGAAIVGFGSYHYKYESGREGDMCLVGFSPRASGLVLYLMTRAAGETELLARLGKHKVSGGCLHIKRLADVDLAVLAELAAASAAHTRAKQQCDVCETNRARSKSTRSAASARSSR